MTDSDGFVQLYAIQSAPNTKSAGGRKSDIESLRRGACVLRNQRQRVDLNIAVLGGRAKTGVMRAHSDITLLNVFTGAGLDATLKQLIRDTLVTLLEKSGRGLARA